MIKDEGSLQQPSETMGLEAGN